HGSNGRRRTRSDARMGNTLSAIYPKREPPGVGLSSKPGAPMGCSGTTPALPMQRSSIAQGREVRPAALVADSQERLFPQIEETRASNKRPPVTGHHHARDPARAHVIERLAGDPVGAIVHASASAATSAPARGARWRSPTPIKARSADSTWSVVTERQ